MKFTIEIDTEDWASATSIDILADIGLHDPEDAFNAAAQQEIEAVLLALDRAIRSAVCGAERGGK